MRPSETTGFSDVVCDLSNTPDVDIAGARILRRLEEELAAKDIEFKVVEAHGPVREILRAEGLEQLVGTISRRNSLAQALDAEGSLSDGSEAPPSL